MATVKFYTLLRLKLGISEVDVEADEIPLKERDHAWFACYAPAESPEIVVVVLVEHGGHGGETAAPIAREILDEYFRSEQPDETLAASPVSEVEG